MCRQRVSIVRIVLHQPRTHDPIASIGRRQRYFLAELIALTGLADALHVRFVEGVFEVLQADHQAKRFGRGAHVLAVAVGECHVESRPVDLVSQLHQRVIAVEDLIEMGLKKFKLVAGFRFGIHGIRSHIARF